MIARVVEAFVYLSSDKIVQEGVKPLEELELKIVEGTRNFYKIKAEQIKSSSSVSDYYLVAHKMLQ